MIFRAKLMLVAGLCISPCLGAPLDEQAVRARIAELSEISVISAGGHFVVVGSNRIENVSLAGFCEDVSERIESITGLEVPFEKRTVRLIVHSEGAVLPGGVSVRHAREADVVIHRIHLGSYAAAYSERGRQAICHTVLAGHVMPPLDAALKMPAWLWKGIEQELSTDIRRENMERALTRWSNGDLLSAWQILEVGSDAPPRDEADDRGRTISYGVFVRWLAAAPRKRERFGRIFEITSAGRAISAQDLTTMMVPAGSTQSLDEAWDRWLMQQRHVVHAIGQLSTRVIDELYAELLISPGVCGIPLSAKLRRDASMADIVPLRNAAWIEGFVRSKRSRLELLGAGRAQAFRQVLARFVRFLVELDGKTSDDALLGMLADAEDALSALAGAVEAAGGILRENEIRGIETESEQ
jgi:hypothetical protein